jgi:5-methylthioribose kinase
MFDEPLLGGVSSDIRVLTTADGPIVVKRALDKLNVVAEWRSDPGRSRTEVRALRAAADLLGSAHVPRVLWEDPAQHSFAMTLIDPSLRNWKADLLAGRVDPRTAAAAGGLLGVLHARSAGDAGLAVAFDDRTAFRELRTVPFFDRVAGRLPALAGPIRSVVAEMAPRRRVLVHGDYSPKNILADGARIVVVDFEVAHWGDPAFDLAFCLRI